MGVNFRKILIPVDFTTNSNTAITRALDFCANEPVHLFLVHFHLQVPVGDIGAYYFYPGLNLRRQKVLEGILSQKFKEILDHIPLTENMCIETAVVVTTKVEDGIVEFSTRHNIDLVIIGKRKNHIIFPFLNTVVPSRIASGTGIPVFTVRSGAAGNPIRSVVVAVGRVFPDRKIEMLDALRDRFNFELNIISIVERKNLVAEAKKVLHEVVSRYKVRFNGKINSELFIASNKARALLDHVQTIKADLLIVSPFSETKLTWTGTHISDEVSSQSGIQVLAVRPV
ncbi:universal stress protein [Pollutibacter soli]|uniref:universal stress protein n=1 Tax=Pollutibacter soli TaxID=3034157 RepID=UPI003013F995